MDKETLYENSEFAEWLKTMPENVKSNYDPMRVDLYGTRVEVIFYIED
jgi:hypothetical protein